MTSIGSDVKGLVARAQRAAQRRGQVPATGHLLLVMLQSGGAMGRLLSDLSVRESELLSALRSVDPESGSTLERSVERSYRLAKEMRSPQVRPAHLLLAVARDSRSTAHRSLERLGASPIQLQEQLLQSLGWSEPQARPRPFARRANASDDQTHVEPMIKVASVPESPDPIRDPDPPAEPPIAVEMPPAAPIPPLPNSTPFDAGELSLLPQIGRNLTALARTGDIDPVIGRTEEIEQLLDVLARRRANNPILIGPPGVGKTAIVEGLALRIAQGGHGVIGLVDKEIFEVSAGALIGGTGVRGALSERLRQLRDEVALSHGRIILFIDETHALFMGGESPDDLAHELKASLARGELPCIGATTPAEYKKHILRDAALARRFSAVHVREPSAEDAVQIVSGIAPRYEVHHNVEFSEEAIRSAVELSVRYLPNKTLPDKAIGLIDLAGARVRRTGGAMVDLRAIAEVIAERVQVPIERVLQNDTDRLLGLEAHLADRVVGHHAVMGSIAEALRKGAAGFHGRRPLATFLFLGPTGVGKTETARALNEVFFPGCPMSTLDMSEFSEAHSVARLLGAPPGYVGHQDGGQLTEAVRHRPYQLVLLDEIEKAHIDVLQALLPLLDEGRLTDAKGQVVDFTNTIIVMTSNLGARQLASTEARIGFGDGSARKGDGAAVVNAARKALPPEIWNRIDEPLYFGPLTQDDVATIAQRLIDGVAKQLADKHRVRLSVDASTIDALIRAGGYDVAFGARPMRRTIGRLIEAQIATAILEKRIKPGDEVTLVGCNDGVSLQICAGAVEAAE